MTQTTERPSRLDLIDSLSAGDLQEWPDLYENPAQQQIAETMYGAQADAVLNSGWLAATVRRAQADALRDAAEDYSVAYAKASGEAMQEVYDFLCQRAATLDAR